MADRFTREEFALLMSEMAGLKEPISWENLQLLILRALRPDPKKRETEGYRG